MSESRPIIDVIIPAFNEQHAVGKVVAEIPGFVRHIIVVNNNSSDHTRAVAAKAGAVVVDEPQKGYGKACLTGMAYIGSLDVQPDIVVFLDADYSDYPEEMSEVVKPIEMPKVTMCCQNAGFAVLVGTLLSMSERRSRFH